jgi:WD40 repeat protein
MKYTLLIGIILCTSFKLIKAQEDVEVVIATGMEWPQASAISPNNQFAAQALFNVVSIWDLKTGRLLRKVPYIDNLNQTTDSIWFSPDSKKLIVGIMLSNDTYEIDVSTGENKYVKGEPFDYSTYTGALSNTTQANMHLYSGSKEPWVRTSPDGKKEIIFKIIKNPYGNSNVVSFAYETHLKINGEITPPLDTVLQANYAFSPDSKYVISKSSIYDLTSGRRVSKLKVVPLTGRSIMFIPGTRTPVTAAIGSVRIWDFPHIEDIPIKHLSHFGAGDDGKFMICEAFNWGTGEKMYVKVDVQKKQVIGKAVKTNKTGYLLDVSPDGDYFMFLEQDKTQGNVYKYNVKLCQGSTGKVLKEIPNSTRAYFTEDPNLLFVDSLGMVNKMYDLKKGKPYDFMSPQDVAARYAQFVSSNHKYVLGYETIVKEDQSYGSIAVIYNILEQKEVFRVETEYGGYYGFNMNKDESQIAISTSKGHKILIYDFATKKLVQELEGHTAIIEKMCFSDDGKRLLSSSLDGTRRLWNLEKGHEMVSLINTGKKDYAIVTPQQYYYATKGAKKLIHFVRGTDIYPFSQFDLKYNRPDIIIQSMEASHQGLVKPFYYAYQKRLKRLGFTEEMLDGKFHMPTAQIDNAQALPITTSKRDLLLNISADDELFKLDRLLVRVNEVPIHGKKGINLVEKSSQNFTSEITLELSKGRNLIEVSTMNEKGVESIADNVVVYFEPDVETKPDLYLYTIGVSEYVQSDFNLTYAAKDANDITELFNKTKTPFNSVIAHEYTNEEVTLETIKSIKKELKATNVDDAICIFFAGHGILDVNLDYYLASYDIDFHDPAKRGIPYDVFEDLLDNVPARNKLIMIDACHSGEIDKEEVALTENNNSENQNEDITFRSVNSTTLKRVGLNNSFELMKELFNDIRKSSGAVIISSAGGMEYAMEGGEWNNGVFTYCFINGILNNKADINEDGIIMLSEMNKFVRAEVYYLTGGRQQPTNRAEVLENDWRLW